MTKKKPHAVALDSFDELDAAGIGAGYRPRFVREDQPLPEEVPRDRGLLRTAGDYGITALKGAISVPEAAVGLVDIPTGGRVGRALESVGFRPGDAKAVLDEQYSDQQKQAFQNVQQAEGFGGKFVAALQNPSVISHSVVESLPSMGAGGVVGRGILAAAPRVGGALAAGAGEGVVGAGSAAEQIRQETPDGLMTASQSGLALASGAGTMAFGVLGNKIAKSLGIHDVDTMLVGAATNPAAAKGVVRRVLEGAASEGILEELPQSIQEQVLQNAALGKDLAEGVDQAAVLGLLSGAAMGGGANVLGGGHQPRPVAVAPMDSPVAADPLALPAPVITVGSDGVAQTASDRQTVREAGPLARAANAGTAVDVEQKPGALARAATTAFTPGAFNESTQAQADSLPTGSPLGAQGGAQLLDAAPAATDPTVDSGRVEESMPPSAPSTVTPGDLHSADIGEAAVVATANPQIFPTYDDAETYRREQKQRGANVQALPLPTDGGFTLAMKGSADYPAAEQFRAERIAAKERADAGILDGDILNRLGKPFTIRLPAVNAVKKAGDGFEVVEVKGGFVARRKAAEATVAPAIAGEAINKEWTTFTPESGTLEVPRAEMPQVKAEHRGALVNFLGARGVPHETEEVAADTLKPTQAEFSPEKVAAANESDGDRAVLVSADGHVVDGHHQWMAKREDGEPVKVIRLDAPVAELLPLVKAFPSSATSDDSHQPEKPTELSSDKGEVSANLKAKKDKPKPLKVKKKTLDRDYAIADYFTPGNVVKSYSGHDRVLAFTPANAGKSWSVKVRSVIKQGDVWVDDPQDIRERIHATEPDARVLASGPLERAQASSLDSPVSEAIVRQEGAPAEPPAPETEKPIAEKIEDVGEKIGGARKQTAASTGERGARSKTTDERPAWARRFAINQVVSSSRPGEEGRWFISDTRSLDWRKQPKRVGASYATQEEAESMLSVVAVARKHRALPTGGGKYEIWRDITDRKRVKVVDQEFASREDALQYMAQHAADILETNTTFGEADLPAPPDRRREGPQRRDGNVDGKAFLDTFGFRGVEFGNWNNQDDRQHLMNDAYDGLLDLAELLDIPAKAIGLNGDLGLAFGARGQGLSGARAHYETDRVVINLTKENGAGSLAHEWFHGLDHYFARLDGKAPTEWETKPDGTRTLKLSGNLMASEGFSRNSGVREVVRKAFDNVFTTMTKKGTAYVEDAERADRFVGTARQELQSALDSIRSRMAEGDTYSARPKKATAEQLVEFDTIVQRLINGDATGLVRDWRSIATSKSKIAHRWTNDSLEAISQLYKAATGRSGFDGTNRRGVLDSLGHSMERYSQRLKLLADAQEGSEKVRMVPTEFAQNAKELDQGRGSDYWTTAPELAARAFQGYVEDKISERGGSSRFLNYGPENAGILTPWGFKRPFPHGEERKAINGAFDKLVQALETREAEAGTALFSRDPADVGAGLTSEEIQLAVDELTRHWVNAPRIVVAKNLDDPVIPEAVRQERDKRQSLGMGGAPRGVYLDGTVYLLSDQLPTTAHVAITTFHEVLGHAGLRGVFGEGLTPILEQIVALRGRDMKEKAAEYNLDLGKREDRLIAAEELLAEWAQRRPDLGFVKRAIALLRNWLRKIPGFRNMAMTDDEIVANFLIPARGWVERGAPGRGGPGGGRGTSFSREQESALSELSKADGLFALPKSSATTLSAIVADNDPRIKVRETKFPGNETMYTLTMPGMVTARMTVRKSGPDSVYGADVRDDNSYDWQQGRPGENPEDVPQGTEDVWIDVSTLTPGQNGALAYNIAATFAHNTGRIFIGDPSGLSDDALRRRSEQMLSSALKFGTTAHLAPHPRQVEGDARLGVPPLKWVYGDHEGNIERLIDLNVKALENAHPESNLIAYDPVKHSFYRTDTGDSLQRGQLAFVVRQSDAKRFGEDRKTASTGQAGWRTIARAALFKYLQTTAQAGGRRERGSLLDGLRNERAGLERRGDQNPDSGSEDPIFYSRSGKDTGLNDAQDFRAQASQGVRDLFQAPGTVSWWHKTVGTMHNLAKRSPQFGKVFDAVQDFLGDVSAFATEAADLAPTLLPKLETWRDIGKSPISAEDTRAVAAPIFEGTLTWARDADGKAVKLADLEARYADFSDEQKAQMLLRKRVVTAEQLQRWQANKIDVYAGAIRNRFESTFLKAGIVFKDAELVSVFKLTPEQIKIYREFRAATDQSLNTMTISEMLRFGGADVEGLRDMAMAAGTARDAGNLLRDYLLDAAEEQPERKGLLIDTANTMIEKADKAQDLIDHGYAPLSRFGHYTVDALDEQGDRAYFGMFESRGEANRMARKMRENYPKGTITQGTVSEQAYKLFAGITPETMELFGEMVGLEAEGDDAKHQMFQEYLKLAKANRSAMKRLIHRKGIDGFSEDAGRVLAGFIYSNARMTSTNLHAGAINKATANIPKTEGELKDMAVKMADYVRNPQEEAQQLRGLMFAQYLGGSLASAMVNMTQPIAVTMPYLSQWGGAVKAAGRMRGALADSLKTSTGDAKLDAALKQAAQEGIVAPQEVHQLMAQARGRGALQAGDGTVAGDFRAKAGNALSKVSLAWGKPFAAAEQFNRRVTFIAAWRTAVAEGIANPTKFAEEAIRETQFVYNKGNKPQWARGAIGATLFTFKQYSVSYMELLHRIYTQGGPEGKRAVVFALGMLFLMGGSGGLPFVGDAEDIIDGILQRLGYSFSTKQARRQFFIDALGEGAANFVERGISGLPGVPIDVAGRLGMGNLIPGTGLLTKKADHGRDVAELLGPAGDLAQRAFQGAGQIVSGNPVEGLGTMSPTAVRNLQKAMDMHQTGMYRDQKGRKVIDVDGYDALVKAIGFQPTAVARVQDAVAIQQDMISQNKLMKTELADDMATAIFEQDADKQQAVRERARRWKTSNPSSPITIDMLGVRRRLINMRASKAERVEKAAPKAIRADVKRALTEGAS